MKNLRTVPLSQQTSPLLGAFEDKWALSTSRKHKKVFIIPKKYTYMPASQIRDRRHGDLTHGCLHRNRDHRVHAYRVAIATFWRTFHHDGKISPAWWGWGCTLPPPFTLSTITSKVVVYASAERSDNLPLFLLYPYMYSVAPTTRTADQSVWTLAMYNCTNIASKVLCTVCEVERRNIG